MNKPAGRESYEARRFAVILASLLTLLAVLSWWKRHPTRASVLVGAAALAILLAIVFRPVWTRFFRLWMRLALAISWIMTRVLLTVLYYGFITPYGLVSRLLRKDPLDLSWKRRKPSYWVDKTEERGGPERYERQF